ncbi:DUF3098 domain-containing protein [Ornithobacterium rhinotracheale]|uniref:DUF3098 domain-containing protein n=1 Tax=Ornithobacterium rhinotracheale TaxID=28251 RepID=A0A3R5XU61_ORNRH|nr:DUF3098 domain-containing protein [Ornithobacterium rhinotracheale]QAR30546.1 DUF3098 domain-containing protein [Ornithobacterium rhinotracheale]
MLFNKKNYLIMLAGLALIAIGFWLMSGADANTRPDGTLDPTFWNQDIFSWQRIRLAPSLIIIGFIVEAVAIMYQPKEK